jgi:hypothetical protein
VNGGCESGGKKGQVEKMGGSASGGARACCFSLSIPRLPLASITHVHGAGGMTGRERRTGGSGVGAVGRRGRACADWKNKRGSAEA